MSRTQVEMVANRYGKSRVRLLKVTHGPQQNDIDEWTVQILLEGDFAAAHTGGDNSRIIATDTMKNTVYYLAKRSHAKTMECFGLELVNYFLDKYPQVTSAQSRIEAVLWKRVTVKGQPHASTFMRGSAELQTATVDCRRGEAAQILGGLEKMNLLKTANSAFAGFQRDELTTLPETYDRVFGTAVEGWWRYTSSSGDTDFATLRTLVRDTLTEVFATHRSASVQHTLYAMAEAALAQTPEIEEMQLAMPNKHCLLIDLQRFGESNPNEIFVPTDEPHGYIEARVRRT